MCLYILWYQLFLVHQQMSYAHNFKTHHHQYWTLSNVSIKVNLQERDTNGRSQTIWFNDLQTDTDSLMERFEPASKTVTEVEENRPTCMWATIPSTGLTGHHPLLPHWQLVVSLRHIQWYVKLCSEDARAHHEYCMQKACSRSWKMQRKGILVQAVWLDPCHRDLLS